MNLKDLRWITCGFSLEEAAQYCHITIQTFSRWEKTIRFPRWVPDLLLMRAGYLDLAGFDGWRATQGALWSRENIRYTAGEIRAIGYQESLICELKNRLHGGRRESNVILFKRIK